MPYFFLKHAIKIGQIVKTSLGGDVKNRRIGCGQKAGCHRQTIVAQIIHKGGSHCFFKVSRKVRF